MEEQSNRHIDHIRKEYLSLQNFNSFSGGQIGSIKNHIVSTAVKRIEKTIFSYNLYRIQNAIYERLTMVHNLFYFQFEPIKF